MFQYNRFWHFWFTLDNRHYLRTLGTTLLLSLLALAIPAIFFPVFWAIPFIGIALVAAPVLIIAGIIAAFTKISDYFYNHQNIRLSELKEATADEPLKDQIDLYLNRRKVAPQELLKGLHLKLPQDHAPESTHSTAKNPLVLEENTLLQIATVEKVLGRRNDAFKTVTPSGTLYIKKTAAADTLSEIAAREMAEIMGFKDLIPANTLSKVNVIQNQLGQVHAQLPSDSLILSRQKTSNFIDSENQDHAPESQIKNSVKLQDTLAKAVLNLKSKAFSAQTRENRLAQLLHIQKITPNTIDGVQWFNSLFNIQPKALSPFEPSAAEQARLHAKRQVAEQQLERFDISSFQENFLLQVLLGAQDCNPGNTLLIDVPGEPIKMQSIDHERIMPEDNYNISKFIPVGNGTKAPVEKAIENVFPIRLWLTGLPQAEVPFSKEFIKHVLDSLNPQRLLAYHKQKNLFSQAAVGAQLDRVLLIKQLFAEEYKKDIITLTPKELFLQFVNNHPSYGLLKDNLELNDIFVFNLLGMIPTDADISLLRHPLQWPSMAKAAGEVIINQGKQQLFSTQSFADPASHKYLFFLTAQTQKMVQTANEQSIEIIDETAKDLRA